MELSNNNSNNRETLPEKEKIIQLISEITTILEIEGDETDNDSEEKVFSQSEYEAMTNTLNQENEDLKNEVSRLQNIVTSMQVDQNESSSTDISQTNEPAEEEQNNCETELKTINARITELVRKENIVQELHSELQKYKAGLQKDIMTPILKSIIRCYDRTLECRNLVIDEVSEMDENISAIIEKIKKEYANLSLYISDMLYDYDVETINVAVGDAYEPKKHKAIVTLDTDDDNKHNTIAEIKKLGFEDITSHRILRNCEVVVYKLKNNQ